MDSPTPIWDRFNRDHVRFFQANVLAPLIAATRPPDLRSAQAVADAAMAWILCLSDVPQHILEAGVARHLQAKPKWMPRPGDLAVDCNAVIADLRRSRVDEAKALVAGCEACHGSGWVDRVCADGVRAARCNCHKAAVAKLDGLPTPLAMPEPQTEEGPVPA